MHVTLNSRKLMIPSGSNSPWLIKLRMKIGFVSKSRKEQNASNGSSTKQENSAPGGGIRQLDCFYFFSNSQLLFSINHISKPLRTTPNHLIIYIVPLQSIPENVVKCITWWFEILLLFWLYTVIRIVIIMYTYVTTLVFIFWCS